MKPETPVSKVEKVIHSVEEPVVVKSVPKSTNNGSINNNNTLPIRGKAEEEKPAKKEREVIEKELDTIVVSLIDHQEELSPEMAAEFSALLTRLESATTRLESLGLGDASAGSSTPAPVAAEEGEMFFNNIFC